MKLYYSPIAPNPRRVRWVMAEKAIEDIEIVRWNLAEGAHKSADFVAKAGVAELPALELDDGTLLTESLAICRYLESRYPAPNLFGETPREMATVEMWTRRAEMMIALPFMHGVRHLHPAMAALEQQNPAVGAHNRDRALAALGLFDTQLAKTTWLAGDRITMADIVGFVGIDFTRLLKLAIPERLTNLHRWMAAMRARPAAAAN